MIQYSRFLKSLQATEYIQNVPMEVSTTVQGYGPKYVQRRGIEASSNDINSIKSITVKYCGKS